MKRLDKKQKRAEKALIRIEENKQKYLSKAEKKQIFAEKVLKDVFNKKQKYLKDVEGTLQQVLKEKKVTEAATVVGKDKKANKVLKKSDATDIMKKNAESRNSLER